MSGADVATLDGVIIKTRTKEPYSYKKKDQDADTDRNDAIDPVQSASNQHDRPANNDHSIHKEVGQQMRVLPEMRQILMLIQGIAVTCSL